MQPLEWTEVSIVVEVDDEGYVTGTYGYAYDTAGKPTAVAPDIDEIEEPVVAYREWLRLYDDKGFIKMLFQFNRTNSKVNADFEYENPTPEGDPAGAALLVTRECAKALAESGKEGDAYLAMEAGFISSAVGHLDDEKLLEALETAVRQGDQGFVSQDSLLPAALRRMAEDDAKLADRILVVHDFVLAAHTIDPEHSAKAQPEAPTDPARFALFLPVWRDEAARNAFRTFCDREDCGPVLTGLDPCTLDDGLERSAKRAFSTDPRAFMGKLAQCTVNLEDPELVLTLRRLGIIDASCTSTMQVNAIAQAGLVDGASCRMLLANISDQPALSASDIVRYVRMIAAGELKVPPERQAANAASFDTLSPATAKRLSDTRRRDDEPG
eukprot:g9874.t1